MDVGDDDFLLGRAPKLRRTERSERVAAASPHRISAGSVEEEASARTVSESSADEEAIVESDEDASGDGGEPVRGFSEDEDSDDDDDDEPSGAASFYGVPEGASGEEAEELAGDSDRLRRLTVEGASTEWRDSGDRGSAAREWFRGLCRGLARNRSLGRLALRECGLGAASAAHAVETLSPFLRRNPRLRRLEVVGCNLGDEGARRLASALAEREGKSSVGRIVLDANEIGDEAGGELVDALRGYDNLAELSLGDNELGTDSCKALSGLLSSSSTNLGVLNVENNQIDDAGIALLTSALAENSALGELNLSLNCGVSQAGWRTFARCLAGSALEVLDLSSTNIADDGAVALGHALAHNTTLKTLCMYDICADGTSLITSVGWTAVFACLRFEGSALEHLDLRYNSVDEGGLSALADALEDNASLKMLDLSHNSRIGGAAWRLFFPCLGRPGLALEEFHLRENAVADEEVKCLARCLRSNDGRLEVLGLGDGSPVTPAGWTHVSRLLCDVSSGAATVRSSNHALRSLGVADVPARLDDLLLLNARGDAGNVAREKILRYHFKDGQANIREFGDMEPKALPRALSWVGRDGGGHTMLYQLMRGLPSLVATAGVAKVAGGKRKRVS